MSSVQIPSKMITRSFFFPVVLFGLVFSALAVRAESDTRKYLPDFGAMRQTEGRQEAIEEFPDLQSCLSTEGATEGDADLKAINWAAIDNDDEAEICLFRIVKQMKGPDEFLQWLLFHEFKTSGPFSQGMRLTIMRDFGYEPGPDILAYAGVWRLDDDFPKYPTWGPWRHFMRWYAYSQTFSATWFPDGALMRVRIYYKTK